MSLDIVLPTSISTASATSPDNKPFYGFEYFLSQNIKCVKLAPGTHKALEKYKKAPIRTMEQALMDDRALREGRLGIAMICGSVSGVIALDIENEKVIEKLGLTSKYGKIGSRGITYFFKYNGESSEQFYDLETGELLFEILSNHPDSSGDKAAHLCTLPPSIHPKTKLPYRWTGPNNNALSTHDLPKLPVKILEEWREKYQHPKQFQENIGVNGNGKVTSGQPTATATDTDIELIRHALKAIPADCSRATWMKIAFALRAGLGPVRGEKWFTAWSARGEKFKEESTAQQIADFFTAVPVNGSRSINLGSLFSIAGEYGYNHLGKTEEVLGGSVEDRREARRVAVLADVSDFAGGNLPRAETEAEKVQKLRKKVEIQELKLPKINYRDHHREVAEAFYKSHSSAGILLYNGEWWAYSEARHYWWNVTDVPLINNHLLKFIIKNNYHWLPNKNKKIEEENGTDLTDSDDSQSIIPGLSTSDDSDGVSGEHDGENNVAGRKTPGRAKGGGKGAKSKSGKPTVSSKASVASEERFERFPVINIKHVHLVEVRHALESLAARDSQLTPNAWMDLGRREREPDMLAVHNGLLNVRTGVLGGHTPEFFNTWTLSCDYESSKTCEKWLNSLDLYFPGEPWMKDFIQLWFGYVLLQSEQHKKALILSGPVHSGKTMIANTLALLVGEYSIASDNVALQGSFGFEGMDKAKLIIFEEFSIERLRRAEIDGLKKLTGGGSLYINAKGKPAYSATVSARVVITTNTQAVEFNDSGKALSDRVIFAESMSIPPELKRSRTEVEKEILSELPGILVWAFRGAQRLLAGEALGQPVGRSLMMREGFTSAGKPMFERFVEETLEFDAQNKVLTYSQLYESYLQYAERRGVGKLEHVMTKTDFGRSIAAKLMSFPHLQRCKLTVSSGHRAVKNVSARIQDEWG